MHSPIGLWFIGLGYGCACWGDGLGLGAQGYITESIVGIRSYNGPTDLSLQVGDWNGRGFFRHQNNDGLVCWWNSMAMSNQTGTFHDGWNVTTETDQCTSLAWAGNNPFDESTPPAQGALVLPRGRLYICTYIYIFVSSFYSFCNIYK